MKDTNANAGDLPNAVITLVHGTWARRARWTRPGSTIQKHLSQAIPAPKLIVEFSWSGNNSPNAREAASRALGDLVKNQLAQHPRAEHFVIGHSHGGNVALKALEMENLFDRVSVICLSTPFLHIRRRFLDRADEFKVVVGGGIGLILLLPLLLKLTIITGHIYVYAPLFLGMMAIGYVCEKRGQRAAERFRAQISLTVPSNASLMIVRVAGDEATALIGAFQIATWLITKIGIFYSSILLWIHRTYTATKAWFDAITDKYLVWIVSITGAVVIADRLLWLHYRYSVVLRFLNNKANAIDPLLAGPSHWAQNHLLPFGLLIDLPILVVLGGIILGGILPMGAGSLFGVLVYEVTVEPIPKGVWVLHQIEPEGRIDGLMHSVCYDNTLALSAVSDWIVSRLEDDFLRGLA